MAKKGRQRINVNLDSGRLFGSHKKEVNEKSSKIRPTKSKLVIFVVPSPFIIKVAEAANDKGNSLPFSTSPIKRMLKGLTKGFTGSHIHKMAWVEKLKKQEGKTIKKW